MVDRLKKEKKRTADQFKSLVANALEFLEKSLNEVDTNPKTTIVDFYTAVELFIKARLMKEHWVLILTKPENASVADFEKGNFQSVSLKDARARITNLIGKDISDDAYDCFLEIGNHRNRLVHFHTSTDLREVVTKDVLRGLCYLDILLLTKWKYYFKPFEKRLRKQLDRATELRAYLEARFRILEPEIQLDIRKGTVYEECESCKFLAAKITPVFQKIFESNCRVCGFSAKRVKVSCPDCSADVYAVNGEGECTACNGLIDIEQVSQQLMPDFPVGMRLKHAAIEHREALKKVGQCESCMWLTGCATLFPLDDDCRRWLCISCNDEVDHVDECQNCGVLFTESDGFGVYCGVCRDAIY